jgi:hypothetical protein
MNNCLAGTRVSGETAWSIWHRQPDIQPQGGRHKRLGSSARRLPSSGESLCLARANITAVLKVGACFLSFKNAFRMAHLVSGQ